MTTTTQSQERALLARALKTLQVWQLAETLRRDIAGYLSVPSAAPVCVGCEGHRLRHRGEGSMSTDRELLELAAKAAGLPWDQWVIDGNDWWNPLTDDGDALRLAVKLDIHIRFFRKHVDVDPEAFALVNSVISESFTGGRKEEATRRAIVRAAAEIGKGMP